MSQRIPQAVVTDIFSLIRENKNLTPNDIKNIMDEKINEYHQKTSNMQNNNQFQEILDWIFQN